MNPASPRKPKQPTVVVIVGPNDAGKSTVAPYLLKQALGILGNASGTLKPIAHGTARRTHVEESEKWRNLKQLAH